MNRDKNRKPWLWVICLLALTLALSACSDGNGAGNTPPPSGEQSGTNNGADGNGGENAGEPPAVERTTITSSVYDRGQVPAEEGTIEDNLWTRWINENGPHDVEFLSIPRWESQQKFNVMFASREAPDLILEYDTAYRNQLYSQQLIMPIDELVEQYSTTYKQMLEENEMLRKVTTKEDGKMYEFARINYQSPNHVLWIRADWLQNLGLTEPTTTEELFEVASAFKNNDPDGNGVGDTFGIALSFISGMTVDMMFGNVFTSFDKAPWYPNENDELVHDWDRKAQATAFKKRLYDAGLVDRDFLTDSNGDKAKQDFIAGKLGIWGGTLDINVYEALLQNNPDAQIKTIRLPESPVGAFSPIIANPVQSVGVVNVLAKDPAAVIQYVDFMMKPETKKVLQYGFEGEQHDVVNGCPIVKDDQKVKGQIQINSDLLMLSSLDITDPCEGWWNYNEDNATPTQLAFKEIRYEAQENYIDPQRPMPALTHGEHMPALPDDLAINRENGFKAVHDALVKSIISGSSYSVEQAIAEGQTAWGRANGEAIDQWYADWYNDNKETAFLTKDMYQFVPDIFKR